MKYKPTADAAEKPCPTCGRPRLPHPASCSYCSEKRLLKALGEYKERVNAPLKAARAMEKVARRQAEVLDLAEGGAQIKKIRRAGGAAAAAARKARLDRAKECWRAYDATRSRKKLSKQQRGQRVYDYCHAPGSEYDPDLPLPKTARQVKDSLLD